VGGNQNRAQRSPVGVGDWGRAVEVGQQELSKETHRLAEDVASEEEAYAPEHAPDRADDGGSLIARSKDWPALAFQPNWSAVGRAAVAKSRPR
jgi:hypothetical protein